MKMLLTGLIAGLGEHGLRSMVGRQMVQCSLRWWHYWGHLWWLPPDGKTQVTIEHVQRVDETVARANGDLWWLPPDGKTQVIRKILGEIILRNGQQTLSL